MGVPSCGRDWTEVVQDRIPRQLGATLEVGEQEPEGQGCWQAVVPGNRKS